MGANNENCSGRRSPDAGDTAAKPKPLTLTRRRIALSFLFSPIALLWGGVPGRTILEFRDATVRNGWILKSDD